jgi:hypothetical protein
LQVVTFVTLLVFRFLQIGEQHSARNGEEGQRIQDGVQVHGEHQRLPGGCQESRCSSSGDLPDCRFMGEAKSELCRHLLAVPWKKGTSYYVNYSPLRDPAPKQSASFQFFP